MEPHQRYGMTYNPFYKNDNKDILVLTNDYKESTIRLDHLLKMKGFGLLTGKPGKGKTTIVRKWSKQLSKSLYKVIYISLSTVTVLQFYQQLAQGLGIEPTNRKSTNFKNIQNQIRLLSIERKETPLIILDEANYISNAILNDLKMIFNFNMDSSDHAIVLLVGLPNIKGILDQQSNIPLKQRITMNYHLDGLDKEQSKAYILEKVKNTKTIIQVFNENALEAIVNYGDGTLRVIDKLCHACLFVGMHQNVDIIDQEIVLHAIEEVEL